MAVTGLRPELVGALDKFRAVGDALRIRDLNPASAFIEGVPHGNPQKYTVRIEYYPVANGPAAGRPPKGDQLPAYRGRGGPPPKDAGVRENGKRGRGCGEEL